MYKTHIKKWGLDKKNKEHEMRAIVRKTKQLTSRGQNATFRVRGRLVNYKDVVRYWERKGVSIEDVVTQRSNSKTPEAVDCFTSPSTPLMIPESIAILERILNVIRDYFTGSFDNGTWFTEDPRDSCQTKKIQGDAGAPLGSLARQCHTACLLFARNRCQEAGQILISATSNIKSILLAEHPDTLRGLFDIVLISFDFGRDEVAIAILRQFSALARILLGEGHPLCSICRWLTSIHASDFEYAVNKFWESVGDHFERFVGPMHISTLKCRTSSWGSGGEQGLSHKILLENLRRKCEATLGSLDVRTFFISRYLAGSYFRTQDYVKAIELGWDLVTKTKLLGKAQFPDEMRYQHYHHAEALYAVAKSLHALGEAREAEMHLREAIDSRISVWGPRDTRVRNWFIFLEDWLVEQGQLESAAEVRQRWRESLPESYD